MDTKKLMVSFLAIASIVFLIATVSAVTPLANIIEIEVNDVADVGLDDISIIAGEDISVKVLFTALETASNVRVKVELEGNKVDVDAITTSFDVEKGYVYSKTLTLEAPYELKDEISDDVSLIITIKKNGDLKTVKDDISLRIQRPSYNIDVKSIVTNNQVEAGETFPVDIVLKNVGYNDLDDLYVTATLSALNGIERTVYFGDLVALEDSDSDDDEDTTTSGRIYLQTPYDTEAGTYTLKVEVSNDDMETVSKSKQIIVGNDFPANIIKAGNDLLIVNPTNKLKIYRVILPTSEEFVTIAAGSSQTVKVTPTSSEYTVSIATLDGELLDTFTFNAVEDETVANPVVILTIILAIIFLVLLVVLIVLIGKKPEKAEEFGESYY